MLPEFDVYGNLPEGIHYATAELDTYQTGRDFRRRGIVEVILS